MHEIRYPEWLTHARPGLCFERIDPAKTALIVVDMQRFFLEDSAIGLAHARSLVPTINTLANMARKAGVTVVFLRHTYTATGPGASPDWQFATEEGRQRIAAGLSADTEGHALDPTLDIQDEDIIVDKFRASALVARSSDLDTILRRRDINTLIFTGIATNQCCESTARDANMMDYRVIFVEDCCAAVNDDLHNAALLNLKYFFADVVDAKALTARLRANAAPA